MPRAILIIGLFLLSSCASASSQISTIKVSAGEAAMESAFQRQLVLEQHFVNQHRLQSIRFHLGRGGLPFCSGRTRWNYGFAVANEYIFAPGERRLARRGFGFGKKLKILHVIADSPAHKAGLRSGDIIARVNGVEIPEGPGAKAAFDTAKVSLGGNRLELTIDSSGLKVAAMNAVETCDFKITLTDSHRVRAFARGRGITVTKGMLWFATNSQLAFVLAHELVHVIRDHSRKVGRLGVKQKDLEREADYVGLYIMARAGFDIREAPKFWRRIAANFPSMLASARTHPATSQRFVAMKKTVLEINAKRAAGAPLIPGGGPKLAKAELDR